MLAVIGGLAMLSGLPSGAQDRSLPPPSLELDGSGEDGIQLAHTFSVRLRTDYCYHQFVLAYAGAPSLRDLKLTIQFGREGRLVEEIRIGLDSLGGPLIDRRFATFGVNAACQVDEVRVTEFTATQFEQQLSLANGLALTSAALSDVPITQGLPLRLQEVTTLDQAAQGPERETLCLSRTANVRAGPSTDNPVVTVLQGTRARPVELTLIELTANDSWYHIELETGERAYIFAGLLGECP